MVNPDFFHEKACNAAPAEKSIDPKGELLI
jgi:hypothetical protein